LAQCKLDITHPKLVVVGKAALDDLTSGLNELRDKVAKDYKQSGFFPQPMPKYPLCQNKIWVWDFAPEGDRSRTRKGWRLFAYVADHRSAEPGPAIAFLCLDKKNAPRDDYYGYLADALKRFLAATVEIRIEEDQFHDRVDSQGRTASTCDRCWDVVIISEDLNEVEIHKAAHKESCPGHPPP
jgi:hypothetical protein